MKSAIAVMLAAGGLVALSACGSNEVSPAATATPTTAVTATSAPSTATAPAATAVPSGPAAPSSAAQTTTKPTPVIERRTVTETSAIPFGTREVADPALAQGRTEVRTRGVAGVKTITYEVTFTNGVQTAKKRVREVVTREPVTQVIAMGARQAPQCDPNYAGACVPIASDVDCAGGSGDGPAYVQGPVRVIGTDIYDLDRDGDGIGCEN